jgi:predicted O-methyltransferase YrrM
MNQLLRTIYASGKVEDREQNVFDCFPTSVRFDTGKLLYNLILQHHFKKTLEVGLAYGLSTLFMCQALKDNGAGLHTAIDPIQTTAWHSIGLLNVERANLQEVFRFFEAHSYETLPQLYARDEQFDFAFIDGSHLFDLTLIDFFYIDKLLRVGGYFVFDDIWMPAVRRVLSFILRNRNYELVKEVPREGGNAWQSAAGIIKRFIRSPFGRDFAIKLLPGNVCVLKKLGDDDRDWNHYREF